MLEIYENLDLEDLVIDGVREEWVQVFEIEGLENIRDWYWISSFGRVKSTSGRKDKIMKQSDDGKGYLFVGLITLDGKQKSIKIHRLVALAFISGYSEERNTVDHIFPDTKNNMVSNLQWLSIRDNIRKEKSMPVVGTCINTGKIVRFSSTKDAERNSFNQSNVAKACKGKYNSHCKHGGTNVYKGYIWKYKEEAEDDANG